MLKKSKQQILKFNLKNNIILKYEYKNIIIKSLIHNRNITYKDKLNAIFYLKKNYIKKNKKICLLSGKHRSIDNKLNLSRHNLNYFSKLGVLQNFKIKS
jgi:ribosomal protein S14